jgi:methyl-accepting chemotaxis protein
MDQGTQQNAAMVEETTAAAHSLAREAEQLFQLLGQFKIGAGSTPSRATPAAANTQSRPQPSPARQMTAKVAQAFNGNAAMKTGDSWEEF